MQVFDSTLCNMQMATPLNWSHTPGLPEQQPLGTLFQCVGEQQFWKSALRLVHMYTRFPDICCDPLCRESRNCYARKAEWKTSCAGP